MIQNHQLLLQKVPKSKFKEINLFNIGTKNFYENPFTEVLSYFLVKHSHYKYSDELIESLLSPLNNYQLISSICKSRNINTQIITNNGKYIDLILYNNIYVIVFEVKIQHSLLNPFDDYERFIHKEFPNHSKEFVLLTYKTEKPFGNWKSINFRKQFEIYLNNLDHKFDNKWDYFAYDFFNKYIDKVKMDNQEIEFYKENFGSIINVNSRLNDYLNHFAENIVLNQNYYEYKLEENWNNGKDRAIRFFFKEEQKSNVALIFQNNHEYSLAIYYYNQERNNLSNIHNCIGFDMYNSNIERKSICCFKSIPSYIELKEVKMELKKQMQIMKKFYLQQQ